MATLTIVLGDDVLGIIRHSLHLPILETGKPLSTLAHKIISANAYIGVGGIVEALKNDAYIFLTGKVADLSLFLAPMIYEFGWEMDDFYRLGKGTMIGHLLECAGQVSGGILLI